MSGTATAQFVSMHAMRRAIKTMLCVAAVLFLTACTGSTGPVRISQNFPTPLVVPLDYRVGIHYSQEFRKFRYIDSESSVDFELGSKQTDLFSKVFSALFTHAERVDDPTREESVAENLDLILVPVLEEYAFLSPKDTANQFYAVSIKYHIRVYNGDKNLVGYWPFIAYGKNRGGMSASQSPLGDATETALRDAAAALVTQFREVVERKDWRPPIPQQQESSK